MTEFSRAVRRMIIRWQLRSLDRQARDIVDARNCAIERLFEIRRERGIKEMELFRFAQDR